jgi:multicomponent Na+:H+ antiporter subunit E
MLSAGKNAAVSVRAAAARTIALALLWWVVTEGQAWNVVAVGVVLAAAAASVALSPGRTAWRPLALGRFVPFFLRESFLGGVDVALRALLPGRRLDPAVIDYPLRLDDGPARALFAGALSLLPGTLSVELRGDHVQVHVLDRRLPVARTLNRLERHVAALFARP